MRELDSSRLAAYMNFQKSKGERIEEAKYSFSGPSQ